MEKKTIEDMANDYVKGFSAYNPGEALQGFVHTAYIKGANDATFGEHYKNLSFSQALNHLKAGHKMCRASWGFNATFVWLKFPANVKAEWCKDEVLKDLAEHNGGEIFAQGTLCIMRRGQQIESGYAPSQDDMMAEDWVIFE